MGRSKDMERTKCSVTRAETKTRRVQAEGEKAGRVLRSKRSLMWRGNMKPTDGKPSQKSKQTSFSCAQSLWIFSTEKSHSNKKFTSTLTALLKSLTRRALSKSRVLIMASPPSGAEHRGLENEKGQNGVSVL